MGGKSVCDLSNIIYLVIILGDFRLFKFLLMNSSKLNFAFEIFV